MTTSTHPHPGTEHLPHSGRALFTVEEAARQLSIAAPPCTPSLAREPSSPSRLADFGACPLTRSPATLPGSALGNGPTLLIGPDTRWAAPPMPGSKREEGARAPNGASTVYYSEYDNRWHGRVTVGTLDNGKPDRRHVKRK